MANDALPLPPPGAASSHCRISFSRCPALASSCSTAGDTPESRAPLRRSHTRGLRRSSRMSVLEERRRASRAPKAPLPTPTKSAPSGPPGALRRACTLGTCGGVTVPGAPPSSPKLFTAASSEPSSASGRSSAEDIPHRRADTTRARKRRDWRAWRGSISSVGLGPGVCLVAARAGAPLSRKTWPAARCAGRLAVPWRCPDPPGG
mmetsp:Transcript_21397/g.66345  ORF Transcript_21397/g.66345 Transcript_21397/m.66345 type:complete len:205 (+) Transcript_21397:38-652(+)